MVVLADQPERRGRLGLMAGNGTFAAQWGYTIRLAETWKKLLPCTTCCDLLCERLQDWNSMKCGECVQWDMSYQNLQLQYSATKDYPPLSPDAISETGSCGILLGPEPITKLSLTAAIAVTQEKIFNKEWTSKPGAAYLFQMYLQQTNIPLPRQSSGSGKGVVNVWKSLHSLLQIVMRTGEDAINTEEIDFRVKCFLSCYTTVDQGLQSSEDSHKKPLWVTLHNFMSLLNLPDVVKQFGPLCNIWEGETQGEGFLWYVKREMSMGLRYNWQKRLLTRIYKRKSFAMLLSADIGMEEDTLADHEDDDNKNEDDNQNHSAKYFVYNDFGKLLSNFPMGCAISGIITDGEIFMVCCLGSREQKLVPIERTDPTNSFHQLVGHDYNSWKIIPEILQFISRHYEKACLLLPLLTEKGKAQCMLTVITNDWSNLS
ncbi:hypothetical protein ACA910_016725 [Epithemia clementina (nom. ined.)]